MEWRSSSLNTSSISPVRRESIGKRRFRVALTFNTNYDHTALPFPPPVLLLLLAFLLLHHRRREHAVVESVSARHQRAWRVGINHMVVQEETAVGERHGDARLLQVVGFAHLQPVARHVQKVLDDLVLR